MNIEDYRKKIDKLNGQILALMNERARLVLELGTVKSRAGIPLYDAERERVIIESACLMNTGPLDRVAVANLFGCILNESRRLAAPLFQRTENNFQSVESKRDFRALS